MALTSKGPLAPGARVGAFVVCEEIGFGATSVVYEAEHRSLRHRVAIKVLRASSSMDHELRRRFDREMRLSARLASVHVPHVYDVGELPSGIPYIVMERLNGATLADWLTDHRKLAMPLAVEIAVQVCSALGAVHEAGAIHRDVKPENIVLHRDRGDGYVIKLFDFGICKPDIDDGPALTQRGTVVGTPEYMSPEHVQGHALDVRTDVYSTGVLLYELLAGRTPFEGGDIDNVGRMILTADPPRLRELCSECPVALETIVMRAMARNKNARHATMPALRHELERFADEHGLKRQPRVWSLLPASGPGHVSPLEQSPGDKRNPIDTAIIEKLPMRGGIVTSAVVGLAVLAACVLSVAYYAYEPKLAEAFGGEPEQRTAMAQPEQTIRPARMRETLEDRIRRRTLEDLSRAPLRAAEPPQLPVTPAVAVPEEPEERARPRRRLRRRAQPREEAPVTTIAVAPTDEAAVTPSSDAPRVTSADLMAQLTPRVPDHGGTNLDRPSELPRSPYDETPANPF